ncbi:hypothetical protein INR49_031210 [Caranx melampygus]|nr:hypothetical protein INR49_031210 [Caranx melampygus]
MVRETKLCQSVRPAGCFHTSFIHGVATRRLRAVSQSESNRPQSGGGPEDKDCVCVQHTRPAPCPGLDHWSGGFSSNGRDFASVRANRIETKLRLLSTAPR